MDRKHWSQWAALAVVLLALGCLAGMLMQPAAAPAPQPGPIPAIDGDAPQPVTPPPTATDAFPQGYEPDPERTREFVASLEAPYLFQAGPDLQRMNDKRPVVLYRSLYKAYSAHNGGRRWIVGRQRIGDCVSWGWKHAVDIHLAVLWETGESAEWKEAATEAIYGGSRVEARGVSRGGYGDGSYGGAAAKFVSGWGVVYRQPYPDCVDSNGEALDLTVYSGARAKDWGNFGCGGSRDQGKLDTICKQRPITSVVVIRTFDEAAAAINAGYPIPVCSGQGFSSRRDKDGFASASGSWSHCMCFIGVRYEPRPGLLCLNSWGPDWISGPKWPEDMPEGSFWVEADIATRMLRGGDSFSVSGAQGFPYRKLDHGAWVSIPSGIETRHVNRSNPQRKNALFSTREPFLGIAL